MGSSWSRRSLARGAIVIAVTALLASACSGGSGNGSVSKARPVSGATLTIRADRDFDTWDPATCTLCRAYESVFYATLLAVNSSGRIIPYLAKSYTATATSVTFKLRTDATCSDGTRVTPEVVKNSLQHMIDVKAANNAALFGPGPYSVSADEANDTVTFSVGTPFSDLVYGFTQLDPGQQTGIVCPAGLENPKSLATTPSGAGPYTLVDAVHGDHLTVRLRPDFTWGPEGVTAKTPGIPETIVFKEVTNETTAANLILSGGIDAGPVTGPDVRRLLANPSIETQRIQLYLANPLVFNQLPNHPTADPAVRQALITAIDPKTVLAALGGSQYGINTTSFETPAAQCFDPGTAKLLPRPDLAKARSVLTADGYTLVNGKMTKDGKPLTISYAQGHDFDPVPDYLIKQWTDLGVTVVSNITDTSTWISSYLFPGNYDATILQVNGTAPLPAKLASRLSGPPKIPNYARITDPVLDREYAAAEASTGAQSCRHWASFQEELLKNYDYLPLVAQTNHWFSRGGVDMTQAATSLPFLLKVVSRS
ncbi:MAG TPA: ABC transporter substrate-binding protein [Acidimicrobiales bacterium]|jgi:peptide/nickel transport system substrate-binding protein|nr:ABC transporter substrate-binding protein [Acidimicrobiales bacterium]